MAKVEVVDLFSGIGGLSFGLAQSGARILAGFDIDEGCRAPFEKNNDAKFHCVDVAKLTGEDLSALYSPRSVKVLAGCAPCQPFSKYKARYGEDLRWNLVNDFGRLAVESNVDIVTMENVPQLQRFNRGKVISELVETLEEAGFSVWFNVENATKYGVPQNRDRLVLIGTRAGGVLYPRRLSSTSRTVRSAISEFPPIEAGETHGADPLHTASTLSALNLARIRASKPGGSWKDWPEELVAECHKTHTGRGYRAVYGRMEWDMPSPTLTTQCYGFGNGRFGHPEQDRAISLREAATLQSFPPDYDFGTGSARPSMKAVGRWIGNAVPVGLARGIGEGIMEYVGC